MLDILTFLITDMEQRVYNEVKVNLGGGASGTVGASQNVQLETVLEMGGQIWDAVRRAGVDPHDDAGNDNLLKELQKKYHDFATSYPIPFRWMVQAREYDAKSFERWLKTHVKVMYPNRQEFLEAQGEYLVILYKSRNPRAPNNQIAAYRDSVIKSLKEDDEVFMKAREEADTEVEKMNKANDEDRRQQLLGYLMRLKSKDGSAGQ